MSQEYPQIADPVGWSDGDCGSCSLSVSARPRARSPAYTPACGSSTKRLFTPLSGFTQPVFIPTKNVHNIGICVSCNFYFITWFSVPCFKGPRPLPKIQASYKKIDAANIWTGDILRGNETAGPREAGSTNIHIECQLPYCLRRNINIASAVYLLGFFISE